MSERGARIVLDTGDVSSACSFAARCVDGYAHGHKPRSRALQAPGVPVIWNNLEAQVTGRLGEIAAARYIGLDPRTALDWSSVPDAGVDMTMNGVTIDVKTSAHPHASLLIWPATKTFGTRSAMMIAARVEDRQRQTATVRLQGWIWSQAFITRSNMAGRGHRLAPGTSYMDVADMRDIGELRAVLEHGAIGAAFSSLTERTDDA